MTPLRQSVERAIRARRLLPRGTPLLVAVSGGLDSMVLLSLLGDLAPAWGWRLGVAHFNHHLRGRSSDADERLVRATAQRMRLPCEVGHADIHSLAAAQGLSIEMAARAARHAFLARVAQRDGYRAVALAHHADDQVELFFLRLLRGAGTAALAGMKWRNPSPADAAIRLVRPLLGVARTDLESYAERTKIRFRADASNASLAFLRNRVRHELIPLLTRRYQPALQTVVLRAMAILEAEAELVEQEARAWRAARRPAALATLAVAVQRQVLHDALNRMRIEPDFERVETLRLHPGEPLTVRPGVAVVHQGDGTIRLRHSLLEPFDPDRAVVALDGARGRGDFDGLRWHWRTERNLGPRPRFGPGREWFDADQVGSQVVLRHWQPGDRFQPSGMSRPVKLQDLFANARIPRARRVHLVVATTLKGVIWWVEGLRIAETFKLKPATRRRLRWSWRRADFAPSAPASARRVQEACDCADKLGGR